MTETPNNFRTERIEKLLNELRYEITRGLMEHEIPEHMGYTFVVSRSDTYPNRGIVFFKAELMPLENVGMVGWPIKRGLHVVGGKDA